MRFVPGGLLTDAGRFGFGEHPAFGLHVDFHIDVGGIEIRVPQPVADHVDVVARAQEMHCGGMSDGMGVERLAGE